MRNQSPLGMVGRNFTLTIIFLLGVTTDWPGSQDPRLLNQVAFGAPVFLGASAERSFWLYPPEVDQTGLHPASTRPTTGRLRSETPPGYLSHSAERGISARLGRAVRTISMTSEEGGRRFSPSPEARRRSRDSSPRRRRRVRTHPPRRRRPRRDSSPRHQGPAPARPRGRTSPFLAPRLRRLTPSPAR